MSSYTFKEHAKRLDAFLVEQLPHLSRSFLQGLCAAGKVTINGKVETKSGFNLRFGDKVELDYDHEAYMVIPKISLTILYEDDDCLVVEKPAGLLTHSKGVFNPEATVATFIKDRVSELQGERAGIVHRLDRITSGIIICAKTPDAQVWLQKQFSIRKVKKTYIAVVEGAMVPEQAIIDMPIERNPKKPQTFRVGHNGKTAQTAYRVLTSNQEYSLVELKPHTGRTHQLRVHLQQQGNPIVGDTLYGAKPAERVYLHAAQLEITLPNRQRKIFKDTVPKEFNELVQ